MRADRLEQHQAAIIAGKRSPRSRPSGPRSARNSQSADLKQWDFCHFFYPSFADAIDMANLKPRPAAQQTPQHPWTKSPAPLSNSSQETKQPAFNDTGDANAQAAGAVQFVTCPDGCHVMSLCLRSGSKFAYAAQSKAV